MPNFVPINPYRWVNLDLVAEASLSADKHDKPALYLYFNCTGEDGSQAFAIARGPYIDRLLHALPHLQQYDITTCHRCHGSGYVDSPQHEGTTKIPCPACKNTRTP